jgi:hypothetical protein
MSSCLGCAALDFRDKWIFDQSTVAILALPAAESVCLVVSNMRRSWRVFVSNLRVTRWIMSARFNSSALALWPDIFLDQGRKRLALPASFGCARIADVNLCRVPDLTLESIDTGNNLAKNRLRGTNRW